MGDDPLTKVKGLISDIIARLEEEAAADATLKVCCDEEVAESTAEKDDLSADTYNEAVEVEQVEADSARLKEELATLQHELPELATS